MTRLLKQIRKSIVHTLRWHRRIGLTIMLMVLLLVATGILLNHSPDLNLSKKQLHSKWLLNWYGIDSPAPIGFQVNGHWLIQPGNDQLFFDQQLVADCPAPLSGAASHQSLLLALCRDVLLILDAGGELIERYDSVQGLPTGLKYLQADNQIIRLGDDQSLFALDVDSLNIYQVVPPITASPFPQQDWSQPEEVPTEIVERIANQVDLPGITLQQLLLDIHSGRILGGFGVLLVDLVGIALAFLALTGGWAWYSKRQLRRSTRRAKAVNNQSPLP